MPFEDGQGKNLRSNTAHAIFFLYYLVSRRNWHTPLSCFVSFLSAHQTRSRLSSLSPVVKQELTTPKILLLTKDLNLLELKHKNREYFMVYLLSSCQYNKYSSGAQGCVAIHRTALARYHGVRGAL